MKKTLKILGLTLAVLAGLLLGTVLVISFVFDPNQYRDEIVHLVKEKTGRDLKIGKKIGWSFFPSLGLEAGGLELSNAAGFGKEPFASIDSAGVRVEFMPLLRRQIAVESVYLHGLTLNLAKNAAGRNNWQDIAARDAKTETAPPPAQGSSKLPIEGIRVGRLDVRRANINWRDDTAGSLLALRNLELSTSKFVSGEPLDLRLGLELARDKGAPVKVALQSRLTVAPDTLKLSKLDLKLDDSRLTGTLDIQNFASPALRFDLTLDKIDLDRYLAPDKNAAKSAPTNSATTAAPTELPLSSLRNLDVKGSFRIKEFKALNLKSQDAHILLNAKNGLIALGPNQAKLYGGTYRGETVVDVRGKSPQLRLDEKLDNVQVGPLLKDMDLFDNYTGTGNIALQLSATGFNATQIRKTLSGNARISFRDGRIEGIDLERIYQTVMSKDPSLEKAFQLLPKKDDVTKFGEVGASFKLTNGVAATNDLNIRMASLTVTGAGTEDLVQETNNMRIDLFEQKNAGRQCKSLPLRIRGTFSKIEPTVDDEYLRCVAQKALNKEIQKGLGDLFQKQKRK